MPTFRFRFEQLLRLRKHHEDEMRDILAAKNRQIADEQGKLDQVRTDLEVGLSDKSTDLAAGRLDRVALYAAYFRRLQHAIAWHTDELGRLEKQREKIAAELAERMRERKIMEKLKEHKATAFTREQLKLEQKRLDEFANRRPNSDAPQVF